MLKSSYSFTSIKTVMLHSEDGVKWCLHYMDLVLHYLHNKLAPMLLKDHQDLCSEEHNAG